MLVGTGKVVGVKDTLVSIGSCRWASRSALEEHLVLVVGCFFGLSVLCGAGLGSLRCFGGAWGVVLSGSRLHFDLVNGQVVFVFTVFAGDSIPELLKALSADAEFLGDCLLCGVIGKEDKGLKGCVRISLLVDAPQNVVEEGLEVDGHGALIGLPGTSDASGLARVAMGRLVDQSGRLVGVRSAVGGLCASAGKGARRLWIPGHILEAVGRAHGRLVGHVEGVEGALEVLVIVVVVRLAVLHGEQRLGQEEVLDLGPGRVLLVDALELDAGGGFIGRDFVEPLDGFACVCVDALVARLETMELGECLGEC